MRIIGDLLIHFSDDLNSLPIRKTRVRCTTTFINKRDVKRKRDYWWRQTTRHR